VQDSGVHPSKLEDSVPVWVVPSVCLPAQQWGELFLVLCVSNQGRETRGRKTIPCWYVHCLVFTPQYVVKVSLDSSNIVTVKMDNFI